MTQISLDPTPITFDPAVLNEFLMIVGPGASTILRGVAAAFLEETPRQITELERTLRRGDFERVAALAHRVRGSSISLGANVLASYCAKLEEGSPREAPRHIAAISQEFQRASAALRAYLAALSA